MNKNKLFILILLLITTALLTACGQTKPKTENEPCPAAATGESILYANGDEGSAMLIQYFEDGNVPEEATFLYDQMGANPEITITDAELITELYRLLGMIKVTGKSDESITDCYHYVEFKLADDCYIHYSFEGSELWCYGPQNYRIENSRELFRFMRELTEEYREQEEP